jgi:hypothetical protein
MKKIEGQTWKDYYLSERKDHQEEIRSMMIAQWERADPDVVEVLRKGGALSVPHTMLHTSMLPLIRTVKAVYGAGKHKVLAVGLIHGKTGSSSEEFCLDGIGYFLDMAKEVLDLPEVKLETVFAERDRTIDAEDLERIVENMESFGRDLKERIDPDTAVVMTGDMVHYGYGYNMTEVLDDPTELIQGNVERALDLLYAKDDPLEWLKFSRAIKNDQIFVGIAVKAALGKGLKHRIFSSEISDYSDVLSAREPTVVASVFYGVWR